MTQLQKYQPPICVLSALISETPVTELPLSQMRDLSTLATEK